MADKHSGTIRVTDTIYIGPRSRLVALSNGAALEVRDSVGANWLREKEWTNEFSLDIDEFLFDDDSIVTYS